MGNELRWWSAEKGEKHSHVIQYVSQVEQGQSDIYERYYRLSLLYDPCDHNLTGGDFDSTRSNRATGLGPGWAGGIGSGRTGGSGYMDENIVSQNIDRIMSIFAATKVRSRFMTEGGDWSTQRRARHMEFYISGLGERLRRHEEAVVAARDATLLGPGFVKVALDDMADEKIRVERVLPDDLVWDEIEARAAPPRQIHHRVFVDREELAARFPEFEDEIYRAQRRGDAMGYSSWRYWAGYRPIERDEVVVIESWKLPVGVPGRDGYRPGVRTIVIDGADLVEEEWEKPFFPFARMVWSPRRMGFGGIGLGERLAGHQRRLSRTNYTIQRQQDQNAFPTTYVRPADARMAVVTRSPAGNVIPIRGEMPKTINPPAAHPELYQHRHDVKQSAFEESGYSESSAAPRVGYRLSSGAAVREHRDQKTQTFSLQEKAFEQFELDIDWLILDCCKDLGDEAPRVYRKSRYGSRKITWADVDMKEVQVQIQAASNLPNTPSGRAETIAEWAQAGIVTQDEARRLIHHPDLERAMSLYTAALEDLERAIEEILDGNEDVVPEPYQNLKMGIWRFQQAYLKAGDDGAPEEILERLREWIVLAAWIIQRGQPQPGMEQPMAPQEPGADMVDTSAPPALPGAPPQAQAMSAIAPEAIGVAPA